MEKKSKKPKIKIQIQDFVQPKNKPEEIQNQTIENNQNQEIKIKKTKKINKNKKKTSNDHSQKSQNQHLQLPPQKVKKCLTHLAICIPDSIISIPQSSVLRSYFLSEIARINSIFQVDQIIVLHDYTYTSKSQQFNPMEYIVRNLQYLETPQYLRKHLFDIHADLKNAGIMNPIQCHHHLKTNQLCEFREGVVIDRPVKQGSGSWVDIGLKQQAKINYLLPPKTRVTVKLQNYDDPNPKHFEGQAVSRNQPKIEKNMYWGYNVRMAHNLKSVFKSDIQYTKKILINHHSNIKRSESTITNFNNIQDGDSILIFFSGYESLEQMIENDEGCKMKLSDILAQFEYNFQFEKYGVKQLRIQQQLFIVLNKLFDYLH